MNDTSQVVQDVRQLKIAWEVSPPEEIPITHSNHHLSLREKEMRRRWELNHSRLHFRRPVTNRSFPPLVKMLVL